MEPQKKLYKSNHNKMIDGVCGGIGEYFNVDPTLVRLAFVALCIVAGGGILAYIVALIVIPRAPEGYDPQAAQAAQSQPTEPAPASDNAQASHQQTPPSNNDNPPSVNN